MQFSQYLSVFVTGAALLYYAFKHHNRPNAHHRRMRAKATKALKLIVTMLPSRPGAVITYVRQLHPHAVEELVLSAAEGAGHKIRRNERYVADGGVDGMIEISGVWHLVQTKRYSNAINPAHVAAFNRLCEMRGMPGLFVSFGRTGPMSKQAVGPYIRIISGENLLNLLAGQPMRPSALRPGYGRAMCA